jgi:putative ABC transport system substrate-binding protein
MSRAATYRSSTAGPKVNTIACPALAANQVQGRVAAIIAAGGAVSALAAKAASATVPIVFANGSDPVAVGLVASLNRPGGNLTGVSFLVAQLEAKRLQLLHELIPDADVIAVLVNPGGPDAETQSKELELAARTMGLRLTFVPARSAGEINTAIASLAHQRVRALLITADAYLFSRREQLVALAAAHAMPAIYELREFVATGGLMSYGTNLGEAYRVVGDYTGRVLKGEKPADLPVQQSTRVELVINMKTANALGITFPITLLGRADEVIE